MEADFRPICKPETAVNEFSRGIRFPLSMHPLDAILMDMAIHCQLPPGLFRLALERYEAVRAYIERIGSPLYSRVLCFYPQGSMAIDATISTRGTDDEYDLDIVAELDVPEGTTPKEMLDLLERALQGYRVQGIVRQTRCITVQYSDRMHLDITPSRRTAPKERESVIAHAKQEEPPQLHRLVPMNSFAFGGWYNARTPIEEQFALAFNRRLYEANGLDFYAGADVHEVPAQTPLIVKSMTTVALQLIKRLRNIHYAKSAERIPPSVILSCHAGHAAVQGLSLSDMVIRQARWTARAIDDADRAHRLLDVRNPEMPNERFTDRWPESPEQQRRFAKVLRDLANGLEAIKQGDIQLEDLQDWLRDRFGDRIVSTSFKTFNQRSGEAIRSAKQSYTKKGGLLVPAAPAIIGVAAPVAPVAARAHTNMGDRR